jgi:hypothetical protein
MATVAARVREMNPTMRRMYLLEHGWDHLGAQWTHPSRRQPGGDRGFYTLAQAIRKAVAEESK